MLRFLFGRLTGPKKRGEALFQAVVTEARRPHWFVDGEMADTIDGRFAVLATVCALAMVRIEQSPALDESAVALTERFVESMDAEHRQLGLNDPGLGRRVKKLVASLERRVDEWRDAVNGEIDWNDTAVSSLYRDMPPRDAALAHSVGALRDLWKRLHSTRDPAIADGKF